MKIIAPAKINLFLAVTGRFSNGFHQLKTVFQTIDLCDQLTWTPAKEGGFSVRCNGMDLGQLEDNLVMKAARLFSKHSGLDLQSEIHGELYLKKNIPIGGGLGGGSSDAASTLRLLNHFLGFPLSNQQCHNLATQLGSDVPFFLKAGSQLGLGRGEDLTSIDIHGDLPRAGFLFFPDFGCNTAEVFKTFAEKRSESWQHSGPDSIVIDWGRNDLELPASERYPLVGEIGKTLRHELEGDLCFLSGSGSTWVVLTHKEKLPDLDFKCRMEMVPFRFVDRLPEITG